MKITIIVSHFYPFNAPRTFRATELAKGLAALGHDVTVYAMLGSYDYSEFERAHGVKVRNLGRSRCGNGNSDGEDYSAGLLKKAWRYGLSKVLTPLIDYPRTEYLWMTKRMLGQMPACDYLITVAMPYGLHWGAAFFRKRHGNEKFKKWAADCGDPFMGNKSANRWPLLLKPLEKMWCRQADTIVVPVESAREGYYPEFRGKIVVAPQSIDFSSVKLLPYTKNPVPTFFYCGAVYKGLRDPSDFLEYLCTLGEDVPFKFVVYSSSDIFRSYQERLGGRLEIRPRVDRLELISVMSTMDFLVNFNNDLGVMVPSKLIDYSLARRPILNVSSSVSDQEKANFTAFLQGDYAGAYTVENLQRYDNRSVAQQFVDFYNN